MILNGSLPTSTGTIYTVPSPSTGVPRSGNDVEVNLFRIVNESGADRTFNIFLNVNGTDRPITPGDTQLSPGAAWDDVPVFQIPPGALIRGDASGADVSWTINATLL